MPEPGPDGKSEPKERTPTETMVHCLEDFGEAEPVRVLVVWTDVKGDICWSTSGPWNYTHIVGMLECVKARILKRFVED